MLLIEKLTALQNWHKLVILRNSRQTRTKKRQYDCKQDDDFRDGAKINDSIWTIGNKETKFWRISNNNTNGSCNDNYSSQ